MSSTNGGGERTAFDDPADVACAQCRKALGFTRWAHANRLFCSTGCEDAWVLAHEHGELYASHGQFELGQVLFGGVSTTGALRINRALWTALFRRAGIWEQLDDFNYAEFENDVVKILPYHWGTCTCGGNPDEEIAGENCVEACRLLAPNLLHKPSGLKIWWYKYPFRGATVNMQLTQLALEAIVTSIMESLR